MSATSQKEFDMIVHKRIDKDSPEYERTMHLATLQTNMAYVLADVAESFALDSMRNLETIGNSFRTEEKQQWKEVRRLVRLLDARLRSLTFNGYETQHEGDYEDSSDALYKLMVLLCDRVGARNEILGDIYNKIKEQFPPVVGLKLEE